MSEEQPETSIDGKIQKKKLSSKTPGLPPIRTRSMSAKLVSEESAPPSPGRVVFDLAKNQSVCLETLQFTNTSPHVKDKKPEAGILKHTPPRPVPAPSLKKIKSKPKSNLGKKKKKLKLISIRKA